MNGQLHVESDINKGTKFSVILNYPLQMPDRSNEENPSSKRTFVKTPVSSELEEGPVPITVIGSTSTFLSSSPPTRTCDEGESTLTPAGTRESTLEQKKRQVSVVKSSSPKKLTILYAEVCVSVILTFRIV
jgi:hypothetical protein